MPTEALTTTNGRCQFPLFRAQTSSSNYQDQTKTSDKTRCKIHLETGALEEEVERLQADLAKQNELHAAECKKLRSKIKQADKQKGVSEAECEKLRQQLKEKAESCEKLRRELEDGKAKCEKLRKQLEEEGKKGMKGKGKALETKGKGKLDHSLTRERELEAEVAKLNKRIEDLLKEIAEQKKTLGTGYCHKIA